jgi:hypothetical protein
MQYQAFEKGSLARSNDKDEISQEDDLDEQYLSMLLANEKDKDVKAYAKMRHMKVRILMDSIGSDLSPRIKHCLLVYLESSMEI